MTLLGLEISFDATEMGYALLAVFSGVVTFMATQNVHSMYQILILVLVYGELVMLRKALTKKSDKGTDASKDQ